MRACGQTGGCVCFCCCLPLRWIVLCQVVAKVGKHHHLTDIMNWAHTHTHECKPMNIITHRKSLVHHHAWFDWALNRCVMLVFIEQFNIRLLLSRNHEFIQFIIKQTHTSRAKPNWALLNSALKSTYGWNEQWAGIHFPAKTRQIKKMPTRWCY